MCVGGDCLVARLNGDFVEVRDSKLGEASPVLRYRHATWEWLLDRDFVGFCEFPPGGNVVLEQMTDDVVARLEFTQTEWTTFLADVVVGRFEVDALREG